MDGIRSAVGRVTMGKQGEFEGLKFPKERDNLYNLQLWIKVLMGLIVSFNLLLTCVSLNV